MPTGHSDADDSSDKVPVPEIRPAQAQVLLNEDTGPGNHELVLQENQNDMLSILRKLGITTTSSASHRGMVSDSLTIPTATQQNQSPRGSYLHLSPSQAGKAATVVFTAGLVWWAGRSAGLLTALMASVPAWRVVDPLPILARDRKRKEGHELDEDADPPTLKLDPDALAALQRQERMVLMDIKE